MSPRAPDRTRSCPARWLRGPWRVRRAGAAAGLTCGHRLSPFALPPRAPPSPPSLPPELLGAVAGVGPDNTAQNFWVGRARPELLDRVRASSRSSSPDRLSRRAPEASGAALTGPSRRRPTALATIGTPDRPARGGCHTCCVRPRGRLLAHARHGLLRRGRVLPRGRRSQPARGDGRGGQPTGQAGDSHVSGAVVSSVGRPARRHAHVDRARIRGRADDRPHHRACVRRSLSEKTASGISIALALRWRPSSAWWPAS